MQKTKLLRFVFVWDGTTTSFVFNIGNFWLQHEAEYKEILDAIKGSAKEKRLASQFIGKFFKYFPNLAETAIDAQLDLCEDEDIQVSTIMTCKQEAITYGLNSQC